MDVKSFKISDKVDNKNIFYVRLDGAEEGISSTVFKAFAVYPKILVIPERLSLEDKIDPNLPINKKKLVFYNVYNKDYLSKATQQQKYLDNITFLLQKINQYDQGRRLLEKLSIATAFGQYYMADRNNSIEIMENMTSNKVLGRGFVTTIIAGPGFAINKHSTSGYAFTFGESPATYNLQTTLFGSYAIIRFSPECMPILEVNPELEVKHKYITFDPFIALFHELVHSLHYNYGLRLEETFLHRSPYMEHLVFDGKKPNERNLKLQFYKRPHFSDFPALYKQIETMPEEEINKFTKDKISMQLSDISNDLIIRTDEPFYNVLAEELKIKYGFNNNLQPDKASIDTVYNTVFDNFSEVTFAKELGQKNIRLSYEDKVVGTAKLDFKDRSSISLERGFYRDSATSKESILDLPLHPDLYDPMKSPRGSLYQVSRLKTKILRSLNNIMPTKANIESWVHKLRANSSSATPLQGHEPLNFGIHNYDLGLPSTSGTAPKVMLRTSESTDSLSTTSGTSEDISRAEQLLAHQSQSIINYETPIEIRSGDTIDRSAIENDKVSFTYLKNFRYYNHQATNIAGVVTWAINIVEDFTDNLPAKNKVVDALSIVPFVAAALNTGINIYDKDYKNASINLGMLGVLWYVPELSLPALLVMSILREKHRTEEQQKVKEQLQNQISNILLRIKDEYKILENKTEDWKHVVQERLEVNLQHMQKLLKLNAQALLSNVYIQINGLSKSDYADFIADIITDKIEKALHQALVNMYDDFIGKFKACIVKPLDEIGSTNLNKSINEQIDYIFTKKIPYLVDDYKDTLKDRVNNFFKENKNIESTIKGDISLLSEEFRIQCTALQDIIKQSPIVYLRVKDLLEQKTIENERYKITEYKLGEKDVGKDKTIEKSINSGILIDILKSKRDTRSKLLQNAYSISFNLFVKNNSNSIVNIFYIAAHNFGIGYVKDHKDKESALFIHQLDGKEEFIGLCDLSPQWNNIVVIYNHGLISIIVNGIYKIREYNVNKSNQILQGELNIQNSQINFYSLSNDNCLLDHIRVYDYNLPLETVWADMKNNQEKENVYSDKGNKLKYNDRYTLGIGIPQSLHFKKFNKEILLVDNNKKGQFILENNTLEVYETAYMHGSTYLIITKGRLPTKNDTFKVFKLSNLNIHPIMASNNSILIAYLRNNQIAGFIGFDEKGEMKQQPFSLQDFEMRGNKVVDLLNNEKLNSCIINFIES